MKNKLLSTAMMLIIFAGMVFAQKDIEIDYKVFSKLPDMTKSQVRIIKAADDIYYSEYQDSYKKALPLYLEVYTEGLGYAPLDWRIAMCFLHSEDKPQAISYILRCNESVSKLYHFYLGKAYHFAGQFEQAKENYGHFSDSLSEADQKMFYSTFKVKKKNYIFEDVMKELVDACDVGIDNSNDSVTINFENIKIINTENDELYPILHPDGILVFTSNKSIVSKEETSNYKIFGAACDSVLTIGFPKLTNFKNQ
jgi:tetratricopeptide (TPR) repeat protein